jgi:hypothetical protein
LKQDSCDLIPLQKINSVEVQFQDQPEKVTLPIKPKNIEQPYSVIPGQLVIEAVKNETTRIWPHLPFQFVSLKDNEGSIVQPSSMVLEGSIITVRKHNLTIRVLQILIDSSDAAGPPKPLEFAVEFTATTNVRAIKGHIIKHIFHHLKVKKDAKKITVTLKSKTLNLRQKSRFT